MAVGRPTSPRSSVRSLPQAVTFMAAATDGVDWRSGTARTIVDASFKTSRASEAIDDAIAQFDTGSLHLSAGTALVSRPTGLKASPIFTSWFADRTLGGPPSTKPEAAPGVASRHHVVDPFVTTAPFAIEDGLARHKLHVGLPRG